MAKRCVWCCNVCTVLKTDCMQYGPHFCTISPGLKSSSAFSGAEAPLGRRARRGPGRENMKRVGRWEGGRGGSFSPLSLFPSSLACFIFSLPGPRPARRSNEAFTEERTSAECLCSPSLICLFVFRTPLQKRQLDGAVHRVPPGFYDKGTALGHRRNTACLFHIPHTSTQFYCTYHGKGAASKRCRVESNGKCQGGNTRKCAEIRGNTRKCAEMRGNTRKCAEMRGNTRKYAFLPCGHLNLSQRLLHKMQFW